MPSLTRSCASAPSGVPNRRPATASHPGSARTPQYFTLCLRRRHWRSRLLACASTAAWAGLASPRGHASRKDVALIVLLPASRVGTWANRERSAIRSCRSDSRARSGGSRSTRPILTKIADRMWNTTPGSPGSACRNHWPPVIAQTAIRASRWRRSGLAPAYASPDLRASWSSIPSPPPSRGGAWMRSSAPAGSAQSAPRSLRGRFLQCPVDR